MPSIPPSPPSLSLTVPDLDRRVAEAVAFYWRSRQAQADKQRKHGGSDQGARAAVTGGRQMDAFIALVTDLLVAAGIAREHIFVRSRIELPGYFRPTKEWDLLVVRDHQLIVALAAKSQVGPSFGNNFNNRTEEAMGTALDLWTAYREGAFNRSAQPWLGYLFLLEDCAASRKPTHPVEPHFPVFPEFKDASYAMRYELFCRKLVRERQYNAAAFLLSDQTKGLAGTYTEPADDLTFRQFARALMTHAAGYGQGR